MLRVLDREGERAAGGEDAVKALVWEPIEATLTVRSFDSNPWRHDLYGGNGDRLVVLCDIPTREIRVLTRREVQEEIVPAMRWGHWWRNL